MAEIGLVASIIGVAGAAAQISLGLFKIAAALGSAGKEVRAIANDSKLFSRVLEDVAPTIRNSPASSWRALGIAEDLVSVCREVSGDCQQLLDILQPLVERSQHESLQIGLRIRWLVEKSKFAFLRERLESLKTTLLLLISAIKLSQENSLETFTSLAFEVEALKDAIENNLSGMKSNLAASNTAKSIGNYLTTGDPRNQPSRAPSNLNSTSSSYPYHESGHHLVDQRAVNKADIEENILQLSIANSREDLPPSTFPSTATPTGDHNDAVENSAMALVPYFRLMFTQEKMVNYATDVLNSPPTSQDNDESDVNVRSTSEPDIDVGSTQRADAGSISVDTDSASLAQEPITVNKDANLANAENSTAAPVVRAPPPLPHPAPSLIRASSDVQSALPSNMPSFSQESDDFVSFIDAEGETYRIYFEEAKRYNSLIAALQNIFNETVKSPYWRGRISECLERDYVTTLWSDGRGRHLSTDFEHLWTGSIRPDDSFSISFSESDVDKKFGIGRAITRFEHGQAVGSLMKTYGPVAFPTFTDTQTSKIKFWKRK